MTYDSSNIFAKILRGEIPCHKIREDDRISLLGLADLAPGTTVQMVITHADGATEEAVGNHTFSENQIEWFKAGSALNQIRNRQM